MSSSDSSCLQISINAFSGVLTADSSVDLNLKDPSKSSGHADIKVEKLKLGAQNVMGIIFAPTNIGNLKTKLQIKNGTVEITKFELGAPNSDISGTLAGDVRLGSTMMQDFLKSHVPPEAFGSLSPKPASSNSRFAAFEL